MQSRKSAKAAAASSASDLQRFDSPGPWIDDVSFDSPSVQPVTADARSVADILVEAFALDDLPAFRAECDAVAQAFAAGVVLIADAADRLQNLAEAFGLVEAIGQDEVQSIMAEAFAAVWRDDRRSDEAKDQGDIVTLKHGTADSVLDAAAWLAFQVKDPARWSAWFDQRSAAEQAHILEHLKTIAQGRVGQ